MTQKEVKKLSKDLVLAIDWAAAEYKYLKELQAELKEIGLGEEPLQKLRKASKILHYVSRAERRADQFEEMVRKKIEAIYEELEEHLREQFDLRDLINALRDLTKELDIERAHLVNYASFYDSKLAEELDKAAAETKLEEKIKADNPQKAQQIHTLFLQIVGQIEYQVKDAERWVAALETSLKKAQNLLKKLPDEDKAYLLKKGLAILRDYEWPFPYEDKTTIFLAQHPSDLMELTWAAGNYSWNLFHQGLPVVKDLINEQTWPMFVDGLVKMAQAAGGTANYFFQFGLP
ncbi:MAG: hypothetical protein AABW48_03970, partial [Nanoarchaeota archaeon]